ncbi:UNVERIFIED_CONTAM: hypothetical protein GTU68_025018 [Idotea baltica]|nr:hypothetical protein [Idotea baltica]
MFTLVDCPGHASLIRTIIGGAQIIDSMMLVVDVTKGLQTQTAECLVIGEILCKEMLVVLNKIDLIPKDKKDQTIEKMTRKILNTLKNTKFCNAKVVSVSATSDISEGVSGSSGIENLISCMKEMTYIPTRLEKSPLVFSVDHCFGIKGQGTVITGTVLQGTISVNDTIEIPTLKINKKVKSIQMFRKPVDKAIQGDRIGVCVTQFDPKLLERSIVGVPGYIHQAHGFIGLVHKIDYYKQPICSKAKFHLSLGHDTVMCNVTFFGTDKNLSLENGFSLDEEYPYQSELVDSKKVETSEGYRPIFQFAFVEFERMIPVRHNSTFIASKLDMDVHTNMCRLAFWGTILCPLLDSYKKDINPNLKVFKDKLREGTVDRLNNESELIVKNLLKKGTDITVFAGLKVSLSTGEEGSIDGYFGQSGKVKVRVSNDLKQETKLRLKSSNDNKKKGKKAGTDETAVPVLNNSPIKVYLKFKKYIFNPSKKIVQTKIS